MTIAEMSAKLRRDLEEIEKLKPLHAQSFQRRRQVQEAMKRPELLLALLLASSQS